MVGTARVRPGQYLAGRNTAVRSLIQPQAPRTTFVVPSGPSAVTVRCFSATALSGIALLNVMAGSVPTPSLVVAPVTPRPLMADRKVAPTQLRGLGSTAGLAGSGMLGVAATGALAGPGPAAFTARSDTEYGVPLVRFVSVHVPAVPTQGHQVTPASTDTSYPVTGDPPSASGAVYETSS